jgi:hypothetical protein
MLFRVACEIDRDLAKEMFMGNAHQEQMQGLIEISKSLSVIREDMKSLPEEIASRMSMEPQKNAKERLKNQPDEVEDESLCWELKYIHIEGLFGNKENQKKEILLLTETWKYEREKYPNWYILPPNKREELKIKTRHEEFLQVKNVVSLEEKFDFAYELAWRYEIGLIPFSLYMQNHIREIWESISETDVWIDAEKKFHWFFMGQSLLREYREELKVNEWNAVFIKLKAHMDFCKNGQEELELEELKMLFGQLKISAVKDRIDKVNVSEKSYGVRLRICGLKSECGMLQQAVEELGTLEQDIRIDIDAQDEIKQSYVTYLKSILACTLHLKAFAMRGIHIFDNKINLDFKKIYNEMDELSAYYSYDMEKESWTNYLFEWSEKNKEAICYELNRENRVIFGTANDCWEVYSFFRVLDKSALPLRIGHVCLLSRHLNRFMEYLFTWFPHLAWFMTVRTGNVKCVKSCVSRIRMAELGREMKDRYFRYTYQSLDENLSSISNCDSWKEGNIYTQIAATSLETLKRLASVCTKAQQTELLVLMKKMIDMDAVRDFREMDQFIYQIMQVLDETVKANMINVLLECSAKERTHLKDEEQLDPFDVFNGKKLAIQLYQRSGINSYLIEEMLDVAMGEGIERRIMLSRLGQLYEWDVLDENQAQRFGEALWKNRNPDTRLPDMDNFHVYVFLKWPHPKNVNAMELVKAFILNPEWSEKLNGKQTLSSMTFGNIPYFEEIRFLNENTEDFWNKEEVETLLSLFCTFWDCGKNQIGEKADLFYLQREEFRKRYRTVIRCLGSFHQRDIVLLSDRIQQDVLEMIREMQEYDISVREAEVLFCNETYRKELLGIIMDELYDNDSEVATSAAVAAEQYYFMSSENEVREGILNELVKLIRARKNPGLNVFLVVLHNIFYVTTEKFSDAVLHSIEKALIFIEKQTEYNDNLESEKHIKECINVRSHAASLAYQMYCYERDHRNGKHSEAVTVWRDVCIGKKSAEEFAEVKNKWIAN